MSAEERAERRALAATKEERRQQVLDTWGEIMLDPSQPAMARMACGANIRDDDWGKPAQTQRTQQLDANGNPTDPTIPVLNVTIARE